MKIATFLIVKSRGVTCTR